jgi:pyruvate dehydrogenase E1 component
MTLDNLKGFRDELRIPITDSQLEENPYQPPYFHPGQDAPEIQYLHERRRALGGYLPERRSKYVDFALPAESTYAISKSGSGTQEVATTMAFVRLLKDLLRAPDFGHRIVPIIPDEARTFGMDAFFPTAKIYNPEGQNYLSVDRGLLLSYKESATGQILHTGINEAGSVAAFTAAATSYATQGQPTIPFYVFYSMFGFLSRGFMIGATAGRTTLTGEGLQHADGHSLLMAATNNAVISYDPAYSYEIGHIVRAGIERMYGGAHVDPNVIYYMTVYNEPYVQPAEPADVDVEGILKGIHRISRNDSSGHKAQILASGVGVNWALEAQHLLQNDWGVSADVWSVTSWTELRREALLKDERKFLYPNETVEPAYVTRRLAETQGPVLGVSDWMHQVQDQIRNWVPGDYATLGADGFGFSDTRAAARRAFKIDGPSIVVRVLEQLVSQGKVDAAIPQLAIDRYRLHDVNAGTSGNTGGDA